MPRGGARPGSGPKIINANSIQLRNLLVRKVMELQQEGQGPIDVVAEIMTDKAAPTNLRIAAANLMLVHALPKQQSVAVDVKDRSGMTLEQVTQRIDERMKQLQQLKDQAPALLDGEVKRVD